jgi:hypothetical protein
MYAKIISKGLSLYFFGEFVFDSYKSGRNAEIDTYFSSLASEIVLKAPLSF